MANLLIDVTDLGGEAHPGDKVVLWKPAAAGSSSHAGRVISTAPVDVLLTNGKATVPDVEPGDMRVLLRCRGVESQGPIDVVVPEGTGTVTLRSLVESQFEYKPPVVSAVQEAADRAEEGARLARAWLVGKMLSEYPTQPGLYVQSPGLFSESPNDSGLYEFNY